MVQVTRETHEAPAAICERIARAGGTNRFGEPNFRVVWGGSRLAWIGGRWVDRDAHGNVIREAIELRQEPKYIPARALAPRALDAAGGLRLARRVVRAHGGSGRRDSRAGAGAISIARGVRALLHATKARTASLCRLGLRRVTGSCARSSGRDDSRGMPGARRLRRGKRGASGIGIAARMSCSRTARRISRAGVCRVAVANVKRDACEKRREIPRRFALSG